MTPEAANPNPNPNRRVHIEYTGINPTANAQIGTSVKDMYDFCWFGDVEGGCLCVCVGGGGLVMDVTKTINPVGSS